MKKNLFYFSFIFIEQSNIDSLFVLSDREITNFSCTIIQILSYIFFSSHKIIFLSFHIWGPYFATLQFLHDNAFIDAGGKSYRN